MNHSLHIRHAVASARLFTFCLVFGMPHAGNAAKITQQFSGGNSDRVADAYPGTEGEGWTGPWRIGTAGHGSGHGIEAGVEEDHPLKGGGAYLRFTAVRQNNEQSNNQAISRGFDPSSVLRGAAGAFGIRLNLRLDTMRGGNLHVQGGSEPNFAGGSTPWAVQFESGQGLIRFLSMEDGNVSFIELPADGSRGWDVRDAERVYSLEIEITTPGQLRYHVTLSDDRGNRWSSYTDRQGKPLVGRGGGYERQQQFSVGASLTGDGDVRASIDAISVQVSRQRLRDWNVRVIKMDDN